MKRSSVYDGPVARIVRNSWGSPSFAPLYKETYLWHQMMAQKDVKCAAVTHAKNLKGKLLLMHDTFDYDVHLSNTMQLAYALQKAHKPFVLRERVDKKWFLELSLIATKLEVTINALYT